MRKSKSMRALVKEYVSYRRKLGYQFKTQERYLLKFAEYADELKHQGPITIELVLQWTKLPKDASLRHRAQKVEVVRAFARYRAVFDPKTEIPQEGILGSAHRRRQPHIFSPEEIADLIRAARTFIPLDGLRPRTYETLFGLLACTGIRISEALRLTRKDVDMKQRLLTIRKTKFTKSRLVPLHPSAVEKLRRYAEFRDVYHPAIDSNAFFLSEWGTSLCYSTIRSAFRKLRQVLGWDTNTDARLPRIHDLRHTFVCRRILRWYEEDVDVDYFMPSLSTYLGHVNITSTYWYITGTPELLAATAARFEQYTNMRR